MLEGKFAGIDVQGGSIAVALRPTEESWTANSSDDGVASVADRLRAVRPELVVLEARGGSELPVAGALATIGLPFAMIHPNNIRDFARAIGRPKRDGQVANLLARFAELVQPDHQTLSPEVIGHLDNLQKRRRELQNMLESEKVRLSLVCPAIQREVQNHIIFLEKTLTLLSEQFNRTVRFGRIWR
jgi:transposase